MTPAQHAQHIRQLEFELHKADCGMGMPRDDQRVKELREQLEQARVAEAVDLARSLLTANDNRGGAMRTVKFTDQDIAALSALKFAISGDNETATYTGEMQIQVARPGDNDVLLLLITLPSGEELQLTMMRDELLESAGIEDDQ